jgi:pimeloyl-ACP methyl ester carboxylesterase
MPTVFAPVGSMSISEEYAGWLAARLDPRLRPSAGGRSSSPRAYRHRGVRSNGSTRRRSSSTETASCRRSRRERRLLAERMPSAELVVLPGRGHAPMLEAPAEFSAVVCLLDRGGQA